MRVIAPALAGVLIGCQLVGDGGGVPARRGDERARRCRPSLGLPPGRPSRHSDPITPGRDAPTPSPYVRRTHGLGLIAPTTIGVVIVGWPYLTFLPALADERYGVGAGGYGVMSGDRRARRRGAPASWPRTRGGWPGVRGPSSPVVAWRSAPRSIALGLAHTFWLALVVLVLVGATALVFQTTTMSLMLSLSDVEFHGRLQSMVVLGFSGFGLAALPFALPADAWSLRGVLVATGLVVAAISAACGWRHSTLIRRAAVPLELREIRGSPPRLQGDQSTPGRVATQCSAMRSSSMRCTIIHVTTARSPVSRLMPTLVARVHTWSPATARSSMRVVARLSARWNSAMRAL